MKAAAKLAGFEVVENADRPVVVKAWKSKTYFHIVYYNHGDKGANKIGYLGYSYVEGGKAEQDSQRVHKLFDITKGKSKNLTICCCHYNRVLPEKYKLTYMKHAGVNADVVKANYHGSGPTAGRVNRVDAVAALTTLFTKLAKSNEPKCKP